MKVLKIDPYFFSPDLIIEAAAIIEQGGIVIHPTDTSYGIAASALDKEAIQKIYTLKGRDFKKPLIVAVRDKNQAKKLVEFTPQAGLLFDKFFPGRLTLVLPKKKGIPDLLTAGGPLGIRMPNHQLTLELSKLCSVPYTTTSANLSNQPPAYSAEEIISSLSPDSFNLLLDFGPLPKVLPSTVVDLSTSEVKILREGPISKEEIFEALA